VRVHGDELLLSPSDLTAYLACRHLTTLELQVAREQRDKPRIREPLAELVQEKGELHEQRYLEHLQAEGRDVVEIEFPKGLDGFEQAHATTVEAMRAGADVIYQATFVREGWRGRADFVVRSSEPTALGAWSYEPYDTKLARTAKPAAVLQLAWYAGEIATIQGRAPARVHVVIGTSEIESFAPAEVEAYLRMAQRRLRVHVEEAPATYPWPCEHCSRCDFALVCRERWIADDHLTRVASIRRDQIGKLEGADISTLTALAEGPAELAVRRLSRASRPVPTSIGMESTVSRPFPVAGAGLEPATSGSCDLRFWRSTLACASVRECLSTDRHSHSSANRSSAAEE
jgi:uncharacterized protein